VGPDGRSRVESHACDHAYMSEQGVTIVVTRTVKAGRETDYEAWLRGVGEVAGRYRGHLGITVFRPRAGSRDYTFVFRFDTEENLSAWESSSERAEWVARAKEMCERTKVERHTGLETWFANPDAPALMPPRWKMVVVSWSVAFPLIQIFARTIGTVDLPPLLRGALVGLAMVLTMTYAAMPWATRMLRGWLYRPH